MTLFGGVFPDTWPDWAGETVVATFVAGVTWRTLKFLRSADHRLEEILGQVGKMDEVKASADEAREEWRGATEAIRDMADGHGTLLKSHGVRLDDHELRIARLEGSEDNSHG